MRKAVIVFLALATVIWAGQALAKEHLPDAQILSQIQDRLYHSTVKKHGNVQATFQNGVATLSGTVDSLGVRDEAVKAVSRVKDVERIEDNIQISTEDVTDPQIAEAARKRIVLYPFFTIFDWATLSSQNHTLTVSGYVTDPFKKIDIGQLLAFVKGVVKLQNNIEVLPTSGDDDQVRRAIARAIYGDPYFIDYTNQALPPIHIIVKNLNVTLYGVVNTPLDRTKAEDDARLAATFFNLTNDLHVEHE